MDFCCVLFVRDKESVCSQFSSNDNYRGLRN